MTQEKKINIKILKKDNEDINIVLNPKHFVVGGMDTQQIYDIISAVLILNAIDFTTSIQE